MRILKVLALQGLLSSLYTYFLVVHFEQMRMRIVLQLLFFPLFPKRTLGQLL